MTTNDQIRPVVTIHECWSDNEANVILSVLRDGGIEGQVNSEIAHSVFPLKTAGLGRVRVLVDEKLAERAKEIIEEHRVVNPGTFEPASPEEGEE